MDQTTNMKLEVVLLKVSDIDRAKAFYENLGWRVDIDFANGDFRAVQVTPHNSGASIIFGKGVISEPNLILAVDDIDDARNDLAPAQRLGMTGILVRTGKPVGAAEEAVADLVIDSVTDLARVLGLRSSGGPT